MSGIRQPHNHKLRDALSSQYVLGTLQGAARRRFEHLLESDPDLRLRVQEWSHRLSPLSSGLSPIKPPSQVWKNIHRATASKKRPFTYAWLSKLWDNSHFWKGISAVTAGLLLVLSGVFNFQVQQASKPAEYMVVVNNRFAQPVWVIEASGKKDMMMIKTLRNVSMGPDKTCALWLTWDDGHTMSLGLLPEQPGMMEMEKPSMHGRSLNGAKVIVSLEPMKEFDKQTIKGPLLFSEKWRLI
ncbi:MAG: anti-sigma factor [Gammaproteobacteria bacterium]|nr:anti-sigma factor [Gammaproteobacteria bacterium]